LRFVNATSGYSVGERVQLDFNTGFYDTQTGGGASNVSGFCIIPGVTKSLIATGAWFSGGFRIAHKTGGVAAFPASDVVFEFLSSRTF
jgi:hypothetical protein